MVSRMKTTIEISDAVLEEVRKMAAERGQNMRQVVEAALRQTLEAERKRKKRFRLRDASVAGKGLRPGVSYDDWGHVLDLSYGASG
jgi:hypothetical protein